MYLKILKLLFVSSIAVMAYISLYILAMLSAIGANAIFQQGGSTKIITIPISNNAPNILYSFGESFVTLLYGCPLIFLFVLIVVCWMLLCVWIIREEIFGVASRLRIFTKNGYFIGIVPKKMGQPAVMDENNPYP